MAYPASVEGAEQRDARDRMARDLEAGRRDDQEDETLSRDGFRGEGKEERDGVRGEGHGEDGDQEPTPPGESVKAGRCGRTVGLRGRGSVVVRPPAVPAGVSRRS